MTNTRYNELMKDTNLKLTEEEKKEGWHFCGDWDGMLLHPEDREMQCCNCKGES